MDFVLFGALQNMASNNQDPNAIANTMDFEFAALSEARNYRSAILKEFAPYLGKKVLEVGAGIGQITQAIHDLSTVEEVLAVEPEKRFQEAHANKPWSLLSGTSRSVPIAEGWESAVLINVLEHIEHDEEELDWLHHVLAQKSGHICLLVPARPELYSEIDKDFGHFRRYTKKEMLKKLISSGFTVVRCDYFNWSGYFAWAITMKLLKSRSFSPSAVRLYDRCIFPWVHWMESNIVRPPLGQSLLAVARVESVKA